MKLLCKRPEPVARMVCERVLSARDIQQKRLAVSGSTHCNARMTSRQLRQFCTLDEECRELLRAAMGELNLSARAHDRILKVARTIADLEAIPEINSTRLSEAIQYRTPNRNLWV